MKIAAASELLRATMTDNGGTFDRTTGAPVRHRTGYMVGGVFTRTVTTNQAARHPSLVAREIASVANRPNAAAYVGTWIDGESLYIDLSEHVADIDTALALGAERGELAVWDCGRAQSVAVPRSA